MAIAFRSLPKGSAIGSGNYVFRHYGSESVDIPDLCFTAEEAASTVAMAVNGTPTQGQTFEYSTNGTTWYDFIPGTTTITLSNVGSKVYFRGNNTTICESNSTYYNFVLTGKIAASGNIMSLLDKTCLSTTISHAYCYSSIFYNCTSLTTAPALPATVLSTGCYRYMFYGCTSLTTAPALPATVLQPDCYGYMFYNCTSLTTAPALPAITIARSCYGYMFYGCTSLAAAPALPATTLASSCYSNMFHDCKSLTIVPALPATELANNCYSSMFSMCTKLNVYSSPSSGPSYNKPWRIPTSGNASSYTTQKKMFFMCYGSYRTTTSVALNNTFYTQNIPVS